MKSIFENVIKKGEYDLDTIINKIDVLFIEGKITQKERDELLDLARHKPVAQYDVKEEIQKIWLAIKELQGGSLGEDEIVLEWVQPTGAHNAYNKGDKMIYNGDVYESLINGNVWSPVSYPAAWVKK